MEINAAVWSINIILVSGKKKIYTRNRSAQTSQLEMFNSDE